MVSLTLTRHVLADGRRIAQTDLSQVALGVRRAFFGKKVSGYRTDAFRIMCVVWFSSFRLSLIKSRRASPLSSDHIKLNFAGSAVDRFR